MENRSKEIRKLQQFKSSRGEGRKSFEHRLGAILKRRPQNFTNFWPTSPLVCSCPHGAYPPPPGVRKARFIPRARIFSKVLKLTHFWMSYVWFELFAINSCFFTQYNSILYSLPNVDVHPCLTPPPLYVRTCPFSLDPPPPSLRTSFMDDPLLSQTFDRGHWNMEENEIIFHNLNLSTDKK